MDALSGICMGSVAHLLHELEVCPHAVCQTCHLAQFWDQNNLCSSLLIYADYHGLVHISEICLVLILEILMVSRLSAVGVQYKSVLWRLFEINVVYFISSLVVGGENCDSNQSFFDFLSQVASATILNVRDEV